MLKLHKNRLYSLQIVVITVPMVIDIRENRDVDYRNTGERFPRHGDAERGMNAPFERDDRTHGGNR